MIKLPEPFRRHLDNPIYTVADVARIIDEPYHIVANPHCGEKAQFRIQNRASAGFKPLPYTRSRSAGQLGHRQPRAGHRQKQQKSLQRDYGRLS